ncbi:hydrogen gas-evolving membrane-bound hydrogenase subunit E, partial [Sediminivirga luteola]|uniref:hydrogen gas-evolving membrane-bound hydrogenase subunit E n=1 Tax=Sediminivirga luteola TaxID=1774748 RepID=UPI001F59D62B
LTRTDSPAAHLAVPAVLIAIAGAGLPLLWPGWGAANVEAPDVPLFIMVAAGVIAVIVARARLAAIISVGVAGFAVAIWFFVLGASDVALTQLLVEILTVVIMVLVLRRLGREFTPTPRARRVGASIAAAVAGVTAFFATLAFTGHRGLSPVGEYFLREAENDTGGTNVVNTILVDFRALDTLGELVVLAIAALAINSLLVARRPVSGPAPSLLRTPLADPASNAVFLRVLDRFLVPLMLIGSAYALLRGHNDPGGGFIAALIGASALALAYLSASSDENRRLNRPYRAIAGAGIIVAVGCGLLGLLDDSFLRPLHFDVLGVHITTALIFDLGVYLAVFGVILAALNLLGTRQGAQETAEGLPAPEETPVTVAAPVAPAAAGRGHDDGHSTEEARS